MSNSFEEYPVDSYRDSKNDHYFIPTINIDYLQILKEDTLPAEESNVLVGTIRDHLRIFGTLTNILKESIASGAKPKLTIEIQKAKHIKYNGLCISDPAPFVEVEFSPVDVKKTTRCVSAKKPTWYEIIVYTGPLATLRFIIVRLYERNSNTKSIPLGTITIDVLDLIDQETHERWVYFDGTRPDKDSTALYVKMQMIKEPDTFYQSRLESTYKAKMELKDAFVRAKIQSGEFEFA